MITVMYADKLARARSNSFRGIEGRGAAVQAMTRDRNDIKCRFCGSVGHFKIKCPLRVKQQQKNDGQQPQHREVQQNRPRRQHQRNRGGGRGRVGNSYHKTTFHGDDDCRARRRKQTDGNAYIAVTGSSGIRGICSDFDLPEEDDQPVHPFIPFTAMEVHPTVELAVEQSHNMWKRGFSANCQHRVVGHLRNALNPLSLSDFRKGRNSPTLTRELSTRVDYFTVWPRFRLNRPTSSVKRARVVMLLLFYSTARPQATTSTIPSSPITNIVYRPTPHYASHDSYGRRSSAGRHSEGYFARPRHGRLRRTEPSAYRTPNRSWY